MSKPRSKQQLRLVVPSQQTLPNHGRMPELGPGMSKALWNLDWQNHFPKMLGESGIRVEVGTFNQVANFLNQNYAQIYAQDPALAPFLIGGGGESKQRYYEEAGDFFVFRDGPSVVGMFVGSAIDWGSYYLRNASMLPQYQGKKLYQTFLIHILEVLKQHGVERAEGDVAPSNLGHIHVLNKLAFNITGFNLSERWGSLVHFTKYLSEKHETVFLRQFCWGVVPQRSGKGSGPKGSGRE